MTKLTESQIEEFAIGLFRLDYGYIYGPDITPDGERSERGSFEEVILRGRLLKAVRSINPSIPHDVQEEALKRLFVLLRPINWQIMRSFIGYLPKGCLFQSIKRVPSGGKGFG